MKRKIRWKLSVKRRRILGISDSVQNSIEIHRKYKMRVVSLNFDKNNFHVRSGIRTHAYISRLRPERSALDHSAILTKKYWVIGSGHIFRNNYVFQHVCTFYTFYTLYGLQNTLLIVVGFEPTPPKWLVPKTSALDHSATLPDHIDQKRSKTAFQCFLTFVTLPWYHGLLKTMWQRWDSNPRHRSDWCLKPAP